MLATLSRPRCVNEMKQHITNVLVDFMCQEAKKHQGGDVVLMRFSSLAAPEAFKTDNFRCDRWEELRRDGGVSFSV